MMVRAILFAALSTLVASPPSSFAAALVASWMVESDSADALFGSAVCAGDFNGDGYGDLVVAAADYDFLGTDDGKVFVYYGGPGGPATTADWIAESDQAAAEFGRSVASGNFNNDNYDDLVVSAPYYDMGRINEGVVFVWFGDSDGLGSGTVTPASADWIAQSDAIAAVLGLDVANAGDVNNDGYDDLIASADGPGAIGASKDGAAFIWLGGPSGFAVTSGTLANAAWETAGGDQDDAWLRQVAGAGDVNGDNYDDVIVGVYGWSNPETQEGQARVFYGNSGGVSATPAWTMESNDNNDRAGKSVAGVGDVNNDGFDDILIAGAGGFLYYGSASGLGPDGTYANAAWWNQNAFQSPAGDINDDGIADILAHSYGVTEVYLGSGSGPVEPYLWRQLSPIIGDGYGLAAAPAGDVNGDGYGDILAGAPEHSDGQADEGAAYLYLGVIDIHTPVLLQSHTARWVEDHVEVEWTLSDLEGEPEHEVVRRGPDGVALSVSAPDIRRDTGVFVLRDANTRPNETYVYEIRILEGPQLLASFETKITTPATKTELLANRPNPFNPSTTIRFSLAKDTNVFLAVYDVAGRRVRTLVDHPRRAGVHSERWDGSGEDGSAVASGVYFLRLEADGQIRTRSMALLK